MAAVAQLCGGEMMFSMEGDPLGVLSGETEGVLDSDCLSGTDLNWIGLGEGDCENLCVCTPTD